MGAEIRVMSLQAKDYCQGGWERGMGRIFPESLQKEAILPTPWFWTSGLRNHGKIHFFVIWVTWFVAICYGRPSKLIIPLNEYRSLSESISISTSLCIYHEDNDLSFPVFNDTVTNGVWLYLGCLKGELFTYCALMIVFLSLLFCFLVCFRVSSDSQWTLSSQQIPSFALICSKRSAQMIVGRTSSSARWASRPRLAWSTWGPGAAARARLTRCGWHAVSGSRVGPWSLGKPDCSLRPGLAGNCISPQIHLWGMPCFLFNPTILPGSGAPPASWGRLLHLTNQMAVLTTSCLSACVLSCFTCVQLFANLLTGAARGFIGKNTGVGCIPFSRGSSWPRDWTLIFYVSCIVGRSLPTEPPGKPLSVYMSGAFSLYNYWHQYCQYFLICACVFSLTHPIK